MREHATPLRRAACVAVAGLMIAVLLPAARSAGGGDALRRKAAALRGRDASLGAQSQSALLSLYALDNSLERARSETAALRTREAAVASARADARRRLELARRGLALSERRLGTRLRLLYEQQDDNNPLAIVLGATTLDDALTRLDELDRTANQDRDIVVQVRFARKRLLGLTKALAARDDELKRLAGAAAARAASLAAARSERAAYIAQLAARRRLDAAQISSLEAQARTVEVKAQTIVQQAGAPPVPTPVAGSPLAAAPDAPPTVASAPAEGGQMLTVVATAYALQGRTATGIPVGYGVVAVDPAVIPLGTRLTIPGYGEGVAADTGSGVQGATIDLWFPTAAQAGAWGRRTVTITLH